MPPPPPRIRNRNSSKLLQYAFAIILSKYETLKQCWFNARSVSETVRLKQRWVKSRELHTGLGSRSKRFFR